MEEAPGPPSWGDLESVRGTREFSTAYAAPGVHPHVASTHIYDTAILSSAATTRSSSTSRFVAALTATHGITSLRMPALAAIATLATAATVAAALTAALAAHRSLSKAKTLATPTSPLRSQSHALLSP